MKNTFTLAGDSGDAVIDVRDIIDRVESLEADLDFYAEEKAEEGHSSYLTERELEDYQVELDNLMEFLEELADVSEEGDEWRGSSYPSRVIRDDAFEDYVKETAEEICMVRDFSVWPYSHIDWEEAADELQQDYNTASLRDMDGVQDTYWFR